MPTPIKLDKSWKPTLKRLSLRGSVEHVTPSVMYGLLDSATGRLMQRPYTTREKADAAAERINARRGTSLGSATPLVTVVTITSS